MTLKSPNDSSNFLFDGSAVIAAEPWFKVKVEVIQRYLRAFVINVSAKADEIIFVDLFSGSGLYSIGHQKEIFPGASLASLSSDLPFTQWILCERDPESVTLLHRRAKPFARGKNVIILDTELPHLTDKLRRHITPAKRDHKVAIICVVDPFDFSIPLATIESLSTLGFNFLIPFTFMLNERLNYRHHLREHPERLVQYLGQHNFERLSGVQNNVQFYKRLVRMYQNRMLVIGLNTALSVHPCNSRLMELPAYYIGLFSRRFSAKAIQEDAQLSGQLEIELFE